MARNSSESQAEDRRIVNYFMIAGFATAIGLGIASFVINNSEQTTSHGIQACEEGKTYVGHVTNTGKVLSLFIADGGTQVRQQLYVEDVITTPTGLKCTFDSFVNTEDFQGGQTINSQWAPEAIISVSMETFSTPTYNIDGTTDGSIVLPGTVSQVQG